MVRTMTISMVGILSVFGAGLGFHLGKAAVDEINPAYFSSPARSVFHADLSPYRSPIEAPQALVPLYTSGEGLGTGCVGCTSSAAIYYPIEEAGDEDYTVRAWTPAEVPAAQMASAEIGAEPMGLSEEDRQQVERYTRYPVLEVARTEPAPAVAAEETQQPAQEAEPVAM